MNRQFILLSTYLILLITLSGCGKEQNPPYLIAQQKLAEQYGVKVEDYPYPYVFPIPYFESNLGSGDPIEEVHKTIMGYEKVYHCGAFGELYYYFSAEKSQALRFMVLYDENLQYKRILAEDPNSQTLDNRGCIEEGLLSKIEGQ